jgi:serine/threonine protein kinase
LIQGLPPFYTKNRADLFNNIKFTEPNMNKQWSKNVRDLLSKLLEKDPEIRMKNIKTLK